MKRKLKDQPAETTEDVVDMARAEMRRMTPEQRAEILREFYDLCELKDQQINLETKLPI